MRKPPSAATRAAVASLLSRKSRSAVSIAWTSSSMSWGELGIRRGLPSPFGDEFVEEQPRDHIKSLENAFALTGAGFERGDLHIAVIEQELHIFDRGDAWEVAFIVLEHIRDVP